MRVVVALEKVCVVRVVVVALEVYVVRVVVVALEKVCVVREGGGGCIGECVCGEGGGGCIGDGVCGEGGGVALEKVYVVRVVVACNCSDWQYTATPINTGVTTLQASHADLSTELTPSLETHMASS